MSDKIDVAVNVFAKPCRTSLAVLSLLRQSRPLLGKLWLQFEPMGIKYDTLPVHCIAEYVQERGLIPCEVSQPEQWRGRESWTPAELADASHRPAVRYQNAFEHSSARLLFLMHNDVYFVKDLLTPMRQAMGDAFAIGQLGQCWNCPAANAQLTREVLGVAPCAPDKYDQFRPTHDQLIQLYKAAQENGQLVRPYAVETGEFSSQPWPLPECRVNEWACLLNLSVTRSLCFPNGPAYPPGAFRLCGEHNLDIAVAWFRDLHALGLKAKNFDIRPYLRHWVGTGNNTPIKYARQEDTALRILKKHFPDYVQWLRAKYGSDALPF